MTPVVSRSPWVTAFGASGSRARVTLFCFPYAGGGASVFRRWSDELPRDVRVAAIQLPGRESRLKERPFSCLHSLVDAMTAALEVDLDRPVALFGHSMGALIAFHYARRLRQRYGLVPRHLFVSGCSAPQVPLAGPPIHALPEREFLDRLRRFNGTPPEVFQQEELLELAIPVLRADFALRETYEYVGDAPLDCPITAFGGLDDLDVSPEDLAGWGSQTTRAFRLQMLPGDHFFLRTAHTRLLQRVARALEDS